MNRYSFNMIFNTFRKYSYIKIFSIGCTVLTLAACSPLVGGSLAKRSAKLSTGIQKAYAVHPDTANRVAPIIVKSAEQHNVDPLLVAAVIRQESNYRAYAVSPSGAIGFTQIIPRYWEQTCPGDLFHEHININCGSYILNHYKNQSGKWSKALAYYNVGPTGYNNNRKMKKQGKRYAKQVKQHQKNLKDAL